MVGNVCAYIIEYVYVHLRLLRVLAPYSYPAEPGVQETKDEPSRLLHILQLWRGLGGPCSLRSDISETPTKAHSQSPRWMEESNYIQGLRKMTRGNQEGLEGGKVKATDPPARWKRKNF